jgi:DNA-binding transcriptional ArsR family regulator
VSATVIKFRIGSAQVDHCRSGAAVVNACVVVMIFDKVSNICNHRAMIELDLAKLERGAELFKAIGHPMRLAMLEQLSLRPWCVCELALALGLSKSVASKHLNQLYQVGLLAMEKQGTQVMYRLQTPCVMDTLRCCQANSLLERQRRLGLAV